jgi:hypothetical protein
MRTSPVIAAVIAVALGALAQPRTAAATQAANELGCRLAHAEPQYQLNRTVRCVKTTHETAPPSCSTSDYGYSTRQGEDTCVKLPANFPPPGSAIAIPSMPVTCPPALGSPPWQLVRDVVGVQDQCQRTRTEYVAPGQLTFPGTQTIPSPLVRK